MVISLSLGIALYMLVEFVGRSADAKVPKWMISNSHEVGDQIGSRFMHPV